MAATLDIFIVELTRMANLVGILRGGAEPEVAREWNELNRKLLDALVVDTGKSQEELAKLDPKTVEVGPRTLHHLKERTDWFCALLRDRPHYFNPNNN